MSLARDLRADRCWMPPLAEVDPQVSQAMAAEPGRQQGTLEMIASENFAPVTVMAAQGSVLTNKYADGYLVGGTTTAAST